MNSAQAGWAFTSGEFPIFTPPLRLGELVATLALAQDNAFGQPLESMSGNLWRKSLTMIGAVCLAVTGCKAADRAATPARAGRFESDVAFLRQHGQVVLLTGASGAQVVLSPTYQGRVMTSTTGGSEQPSFGWIGRAAIASGERQPHMN